MHTISQSRSSYTIQYIEIQRLDEWSYETWSCTISFKYHLYNGILQWLTTRWAANCTLTFNIMISKFLQNLYSTLPSLKRLKASDTYAYKHVCATDKLHFNWRLQSSIIQYNQIHSIETNQSILLYSAL